MFKGDDMSPPGNRVFNQYRKSEGGSDVIILSMKKIMLHRALAMGFVISRIQNIQRLGLLSPTEELYPTNLYFHFNASIEMASYISIGSLCAVDLCL